MTGPSQNKLLEVNNLSISFPLEERTVMAVRNVSFQLEEGKTMGLVGESGCGKSVTAFSLLRLVPPPGVIESGSIAYRGRDITAMPEEEIRKIRGKDIAMIFQEPMTSLNPVFTIGSQISESLQLHFECSKQEARDRAVDILNQVGIPSPAKRFSSYPHELSGGMRQRVMIAIALAGEPGILIADEPTTALDVTIQAQILDLLLNIQQKRNMALILITHDLGIVANMADDIAIMYAGEIVEQGSAETIFASSGHPYTKGLFESIPRMGSNVERLKSIPGMVPTISDTPGSCVFHPRCPVGIDDCLKGPVVFSDKGDSHRVRCIRY